MVGCRAVLETEGNATAASVYSQEMRSVVVVCVLNSV